MTTITYRNGIIAADSGVWVEDTLSHKTKKLYRLKDGSVAGFCGALTEALALIEWLNGDKDVKVNWSQATILVIKPTGRMLMYDAEKPVVLRKTPYVAIGSGTSIALGAFHHGATAIEAVQAAIAHDAKSIGPVSSLKVNE